ncbi:MAG: DUF362 domain-containing protein [Candidatus Bathyarchaeia archaeon]
MSKVYFMDDRYTGLFSSLPAKAKQLFEHAGLQECFHPGDSVAIKCHMGEWYNTAYLRPILVRAVVDAVKEHGGLPFVTDTTTAPYYYYGSRSTAQFYLETAAANGFTKESMGCPIIIADGNYGVDDVRVDIPDGLLLKEGFLASGIYQADAVIVVSHFKGHVSGVFGGGIKNVAIGCSSKRGKINIHLTTHPEIGWNSWSFKGENCIGGDCPDATLCDNICPAGAIHVLEDRMVYDKEKCIGCFGHQKPLFNCKVWGDEKIDDWRHWFLIAMGDAATGYVREIGKNNVGFITYAIDISPGCDCAPGSDRAIIPNMGVFASRDMVAIDTATLDMSTRMPGVPGSQAVDKKIMEPGVEKFTHLTGRSQWITVNTCSRLGIGSKDYELIIPPVSDEESKFCFPYFSPEKPSGYYLAKGLRKLKTLLPEGGFKYNMKPLVPLSELMER